jgi:acylphosphatase
MSATIRRVVIRGRVQGVGYRAWLEFRASGLDLRGWVRNRRDGSVEALFEGAEDIVIAMIASCWRGPTSARVDDIDEQAAGPDELGLRRAGERFSVLPTI